MRKLIEKLNYYTKKYDEGDPQISDAEWDELYYQLKNLERSSGVIYPDSPTQKVNYEIVNSLEKVRHNHPMLSLEKSKDKYEIRDFIGKHDWIVMTKLDGLTCSLTYSHGKLIKAETRGNGAIGENILHNAKVVKNIPQIINNESEQFIVDGEIICTNDDFKKFSIEYKNSRNFASGSIRLLDSAECKKRDLSFIAWDCIFGLEDKEYLSEKLAALKNIGFEVVPYVSDADELNIDAALDSVRFLNKNYPSDGFVFKYDNCKYYESLGYTDHHFRGGIALKEYDEKYDTHLLNIEWTMGRTGALTPVAVFEPVDIDGAVIERASLHNLSIMDEIVGAPFKNQLIQIYRANMIIPQVYSAEGQEVGREVEFIPIPRTCPYCSEPTEIKQDNDSKVLVCNNSACPSKIINRLDHFLGEKGLNIKGISKATIEKLIDYGWINELSDIFKLKTHRRDWIEKPGFGIRSVEKILDSIEQGRAQSLENFICALGIPLIGRTVSKDLVKYVSSWEDFREKIKTKYNFCKLDGFGEIKAYNLLTFDYSEADEAAKYINFIAPEAKEENADDALAGMIICITGSLKKYSKRADLQAEIEKRGGKVASAISGKTKILINNNLTSTSEKNREAQRRGIQIMTEEDFIKKFLT